MTKKKLAYLLVLPSIILVGGVVIYPLFRGVYISFHELEITFGGLLKAPRFIGLNNYLRLSEDPIFWLAFKNTLLWILVTVSGQFLLGLSLALLLKGSRLKGFLSGIALIPWAMPVVAVGIMWRWIYEPVGGHLNMVLLATHLIEEPISFLTDERYIWPALYIISIWKSFPFMFVTLSAGLATIPPQLYEAAKLDGAGPMACFFHITLPSLRLIIGIAVLLASIWSWNGFAIIYVVTGGGPAFYSMILSPFIYQTALTYGYLGYAASAGVFMIISMMVFAVIYIRVSKVDI